MITLEDLNFLLTFFLVAGSLIFFSYEQGFYDGQKDFCKGELVKIGNKIECKEYGFWENYQEETKLKNSKPDTFNLKELGIK
jgi:hypothetical protein